MLVLFFFTFGLFSMCKCFIICVIQVTMKIVATSDDSENTHTRTHTHTHTHKNAIVIFVFRCQSNILRVNLKETEKMQKPSTFNLFS